MARFVVFAYGDGSPVAVNPEHVTDVTPRTGRPDRTDIVLVNSDRNDEQTVLTVRGSFESVVARLNGDEARAIETVHLTGWVLDPNHPDRRYRLHPSILTDGQPPAWAQQPATNGGDE